MLDTHAHLNFNAYKDDLTDVLTRCVEKGMTVINVGSQYSTSKRAVEMAEKYDWMYAAVGLHPIHLMDGHVNVEVDENEAVDFASRHEDFDYDKYFELAKTSKKVVAIGEPGIDYYHLKSGDIEKEKKKQTEVFIGHIELANKLGLPMSIHCRDAYDVLIDILKQHKVEHGGSIHCFGGNWAQAEELLNLGFYLGFTGVITFKNRVEHLHETVRKMPEDRILSETDCPYLTPVPFRGKRNEPAYVEYVINKIAELRGWDAAKTDRITTENGKRLFGIHL